VFGLKVLLDEAGFNGIQDRIYPNFPLLPALAAISATGCVAQTVRSRRLLTEWKVVSGSLLLFCLGISSFLLLPIFSMTNPPINWAYPRTVAGFFHCITRGQYEALSPVSSLPALLLQIRIAAKVALAQLGLGYIVLATVPFLAMRWVKGRAVKWLLGLLAVYLSLSIFLFSVLNLSDSRSSMEMDKVFHSPSHLVLAILAGYGMVLVAATFGGTGRPGRETCASTPENLKKSIT
jgi:hypothetical protein